MTMVARGRDLKARVSRLEVDLPAVEKALLAESSQFEFAYSEGRLLSFFQILNPAIPCDDICKRALYPIPESLLSRGLFDE